MDTSQLLETPKNPLLPAQKCARKRARTDKKSIESRPCLRYPNQGDCSARVKRRQQVEVFGWSALRGKEVFAEPDQTDSSERKRSGN